MTKRRIQDIVLPEKPHGARPIVRTPKKKQVIHDNVTKTKTAPAKSSKKATKVRTRKQSSPSRDLSKKRRAAEEDLMPNSTPASAVKEKGPERGTRFLWWVACIAVIVLVYSISTLFTQASIMYTPKSVTAELSTSFRAYQNAIGEQLSFDTLVLEESASEVVTSSGTETVSKKASGVITVYNNHSTQSQRLVEETRFEASDGRIYKLGKGAGIVIPGKRGDTPGSIDVAVYAEEAGVAYNGEPEEFTIPGFKGSEKYNNFYARAKTPMTGGLTEERPIVDDEQLSLVRERLESTLTQQLKTSIGAHVLPEFVVFNNTAVIHFNPDDETYSQRSDGVMVLQKKGYLSVPLFSRDILSSYIVETVLDYEGKESISVTNLEELSFDFTEEISDLATTEEFTFTLSGNPRLEWYVDERQIAYDVADASKKSFQGIAARHAGIQSAELVIKPFWRNTIPKNTKRITVMRDQNTN